MDSEIDASLVDKLASIEKLLAEYEDKIHISKINVNQPNLNINRELLLSMDVDELQVLSWDYGYYALAIQKEINKHQSRFNWAEANLKRYLERESPNYEGWKWEERQANALSDNIYAQKLHDLKVRSKLAIDKLAFLPSKIQFLAELARDIMKTKRYKND